MPTARPIIIEKFIDHTDIGVNAVRAGARLAKPTAMPASASSEREPGGDQRAERDEQQDHARQAAEQFGLVERFGVDLVEVAPHRPLAGDLGLRAGGQVQSVLT